MTIEERIEAEQKLIEEVKAELAAKAAPRRNWPEKVEAGMIFKARFTEATWMATGRELEIIRIANGAHGGWGGERRDILQWNRHDGFSGFVVLSLPPGKRVSHYGLSRHQREKPPHQRRPSRMPRLRG